MARIFYSSLEAASLLGVTEPDLEDRVCAGRLRQFQKSYTEIFSKLNKAKGIFSRFDKVKRTVCE